MAVKCKECVRVRKLTMSIFQAVNLWQLVARLRPELLHVSVCLQGKQIKDASHFRGCKSAPGDGSGVSDTPNPPWAASTYRLPIHVSSKWTLRTSRVIKCSRNKPCYLFKQCQKFLPRHYNWVSSYLIKECILVKLKSNESTSASIFIVSTCNPDYRKMIYSWTRKISGFTSYDILNFPLKQQHKQGYQFIIHSSISAFSSSSYGIFSSQYNGKKKNQWRFCVEFSLGIFCFLRCICFLSGHK